MVQPHRPDTGSGGFGAISNGHGYRYMLSEQHRLSALSCYRGTDEWPAGVRLPTSGSFDSNGHLNSRNYRAGSNTTGFSLHRFVAAKRSRGDFCGAVPLGCRCHCGARHHCIVEWQDHRHDADIGCYGMAGHGAGISLATHAASTRTRTLGRSRWR